MVALAACKAALIRHEGCCRASVASACVAAALLLLLSPGDGRLGLLIAQVLALKAPGRVVHFGRHVDKMVLVKGTTQQVISTDKTAAEYSGQFDLVVEATGAQDNVTLQARLDVHTDTRFLVVFCS